MKERVRQYQWLIVVVLIYSFVAFNFAPLIWHSIHSPPDRFFTLSHGNLVDYYLYLGFIRTGIDGNVLPENPYDAALSQKSLRKVFWSTLGIVWRPLGLQTPLIYHLTRLVFSFTLLLSAYFLISQLFPHRKRLLPFFFILIVGGSFFEVDQGFSLLKSLAAWWSGKEVDILSRVAFLPHHLFGQTLMIVSIILLVRFFSKPQWRSIFLAALAVNFAGLAHPPSNFIVSLALLPAYGIFIARILLLHGTRAFKQYVRHTRRQIVGFVLFTLCSLVSLIAMAWQAKLGFPWNQIFTEVGWQLSFDEHIILSIGVLLPFVLIGIISVLLIGEWPLLLVLCWLTIPLALIPFAAHLGIADWRLAEGYPYLPLGILAAIGFYTVSQIIGTVVSRRTILSASTVSRISSVVFLFIILSASIPTIVVNEQAYFREYESVHSNTYLPTDILILAQWFNTRFAHRVVADRPVVLADFYTANYLPAFASVRVFVGHFLFSSNWEQHAQIADRFLSGHMDGQEAKKLIDDNHIAYIVVSENNWQNTNRYPQLLRQVFATSSYTVFMVKG